MFATVAIHTPRISRTSGGGAVSRGFGAPIGPRPMTTGGGAVHPAAASIAAASIPVARRAR
jgi:hypothetical protein